jgi:hypothetical protein
MQNEMNKMMNRNEWMAFGDSKRWILNEFKAYVDGYNDEGWARFNNPYEQNSLGWWLYNAGGYDYL